MTIVGDKVLHLEAHMVYDVVLVVVKYVNGWGGVRGMLCEKYDRLL